tara:strand:- start:1091 stop:1330 length:240 start_codon:yes stop_codon:yes gene_type:complete
MLIICLAGFCTAYYFVNILQAPMRIKRVLKLDPVKRIKPFDCVQCFSVWLAIVFYFLPIEIAQFFAVIFAAGFLGSKVQ